MYKYFVVFSWRNLFSRGVGNVDFLNNEKLDNIAAIRRMEEKIKKQTKDRIVTITNFQLLEVVGVPIKRSPLSTIGG